MSDNRARGVKKAPKVHIVGPKGDSIPVHGCLIHFPEGAFERDAKVSVSLNISNLPDDRISISSEIDVAHDLPLLKPATIQLSTWCIKDGPESQDVMVKVLRKPRGSERWETMVTQPLGDSTMIEFKCQDLSPIVAVLDSVFSVFSGIKYFMSGVLYTGEEDNEIFIGLFFENSTLRKATEKKMKEMGTLKRIFNTFEISLNETVTAKLTATRQNVTIIPSSSTLTLDHEFVRSSKTRIYSFTLGSPKLEIGDRVEMLGSVTKNDRTEPTDIQAFFYTWCCKETSLQSASAEEPL